MTLAPGLGAEDALADIGKGLDAAAAIRAELAVVFGADFALGDFLDVAAGADPLRAELGQAGHDVDALRGIGVGPAGVVEGDRRLAARRLEVDRAHGDAQAAPDMDLARAADRPGGDFKLGSGRASAIVDSPSPYAGVSRIRFGGSRR